MIFSWIVQIRFCYGKTKRDTHCKKQNIRNKEMSCKKIDADVVKKNTGKDFQKTLYEH